MLYCAIRKPGAAGKKIIRQRELSIPVYTAVLEDAVTPAKDMIQQGTWLFISRGVTRELLEHTTQTTVVKVPVLASDYIPVFEKNPAYPGTDCIFSPPNPSAMSYRRFATC